MTSVIRGNDNFDSSSVGSPTYDAVGTYALMYRAFVGVAGQTAPGTTVAGSALWPANTYDNGNNNRPSYSGSGRPSGTWRLMGQLGYYNETTAYNSDEMYTSLYVRIS